MGAMGVGAPGAKLEVGAKFQTPIINPRLPAVAAPATSCSKIRSVAPGGQSMWWDTMLPLPGPGEAGGGCEVWGAALWPPPPSSLLLLYLSTSELRIAGAAKSGKALQGGGYNDDTSPGQ